jgi:murein DD-endopeptidase MepM/ murein hydrolase activator NlpD
VLTSLIASLVVLMALSASAFGVALPKRDTQRLAPGAPAAKAQTARVGAATLRPGSSGQSVKALQQRLRSRGKRVAVDGSYGPATVKAVKALQRQLGMKQTGIATKAFLRKLGLKSFPSAQSGSTGRSAYLVAFPFPPSVDYSYSNDFGAPRSQGSHQGIDIIGPKGAPVVSVSYGVVERAQRVESGLGGRYIWIRDPKGNLFYYAHLDTLAPGIEVGAEVWPSRLIGTNGNTGDARFGIEHIHFEIRPNGFSNVTNPFSHLVSVDPKRD